MRRAGMTATWYRTYGPTIRNVMVVMTATVLALAFLYAVLTVFFAIIQGYQQSHTPPAPTVTQTTDPVELSKLLSPNTVESPPVCAPFMNFLRLDGCPVILR